MVGGGQGYAQVAQRFNVEHLVPFLINVVKSSSGDYLIFDEKGVFPFLGFIFSSSAEAGINHMEEFNYGFAQIGDAGITRSTTTITIKEGLYERKPPYYIITGGNEIIEVVSETDPTQYDSIFTVRRGALGSTITTTGLVEDDWVSILNVVVLSSEYTGYLLGLAIALPADGGESCFRT
jgi:hypothetical protein